MMQREYVHVSLRNWRKWSLLWEASDQHVEDLDHGESIRAPTPRYKLVHVTVAVRLGKRLYCATQTPLDR